MFDIWSFMLQTLTVSGVAALILVIKALFKDKLSPKWQFAVFPFLWLFVPGVYFHKCERPYSQQIQHL